MMATPRERFEYLSNFQSECLKFFSAASYKTESADFKTNAARLSSIVSFLFLYLKPGVEETLKQIEEENSSNSITSPAEPSSSGVTPPSQDVSFSTQQGRELPIAVQVSTEVATAVSNDESVEVFTSNSFECSSLLDSGNDEASNISNTGSLSVRDSEMFSSTPEDEVLSETESLVSDFGYLFSSIAETSPATSEMSVSTTRGAPDTTGSLQTSSSKLSQDMFVNNILQAFRKVAPNSRYKPRRHRGKKSRVIPSELSMLWSHSSEIFQERQVSSPQAEIIPKVNWDKVNQGAMRRFPKPDWQPISSVSPLSSFYEKSCKCPAMIAKHYAFHSTWEPNVCSHLTQFEMNEPFGALPGYVTNLGVVPVPDTPIHGHVWDQASRDWILHAEYPTPGFTSILRSTSCPTLQQDRRPASSRRRGDGERRRRTRRPPERR